MDYGFIKKIIYLFKFIYLLVTFNVKNISSYKIINYNNDFESNKFMPSLLYLYP